MFFHLDLRVKWHLLSGIGKNRLDIYINFYDWLVYHGFLDLGARLSLNVVSHASGG